MPSWECKQDREACKARMTTEQFSAPWKNNARSPRAKWDDPPSPRENILLQQEGWSITISTREQFSAPWGNNAPPARGMVHHLQGVMTDHYSFLEATKSPKGSSTSNDPRNYCSNNPRDCGSICHLSPKRSILISSTELDLDLSHHNTRRGALDCQHRMDQSNIHHHERLKCPLRLASPARW